MAIPITQRRPKRSLVESRQVGRIQVRYRRLYRRCLLGIVHVARWVLTAVALWSMPIHAQFLPTYSFRICTKPTPPICVGLSFTYESETSFTQCRDSVSRYVMDVERFRSCVIERAEEAAAQVIREGAEEADDAVEEANGVVERFNCRASGTRFCL